MIDDEERREMSTITMDGQEVAFDEGETLFEISRRLGREVPSLCYDDRLEAFGACRLCVVEIEGFRNPVASCTTKAEDGMVVTTSSVQVEKYRKTLVEMVASENREVAVSPLRGHASGEMAALVDRYEVVPGRFVGATSGKSRLEDGNPFILRDYDLCISCYRCVRVCAEQQGDHAIAVAGRGFDTRIVTEFDGELGDSACVFCGQCVQTCPTGALADKKALRSADLPGEIEKTRTICTYCGVGCSVDLLTKGDRLVGVQPAMDGPANEGALCVKGQFAFDFVQHEDRLSSPMVRDEQGRLVKATWDEALDRAARGFREVEKKHGRHSVYGIASGRAPHEAAYLMQKWIRTGFGTNFIDNCSRA